MNREYKKIWVFVEGHSEKQFALWYFRKNSSIKNIPSEFDFVKETAQDCFHITDCKSGDKIPHEINNLHYKIKQANLTKTIVICDLERIPCPSLKRNDLITKITNLDANDLFYVFSIPTIEAIYCSENELTISILKINYKNQFQKELACIKSEQLQAKNKPYDKLKKIHRQNGLNYRESIFSENFFSRLDYRKSLDPIIKRFCNILN